MCDEAFRYGASYSYYCLLIQRYKQCLISTKNSSTYFHVTGALLYSNPRSKPIFLYNIGGIKEILHSLQNSLIFKGLYLLQYFHFKFNAFDIEYH